MTRPYENVVEELYDKVWSDPAHDFILLVDSELWLIFCLFEDSRGRMLETRDDKFYFKGVPVQMCSHVDGWRLVK
jgi:hypothetical protein